MREEMGQDVKTRLRSNPYPNIFILSILGLIAVTWFRGNHFISGVDLYFPQQRWDFFKLSLQSWDNRSIGDDNFRMLAISLPYGLFLGLTELLNISLLTTQKLWFYALFLATGLSMFYLVSVFTKWVKGSPDYLMALLAGVFYMFNPFMGLMLSTFSYAFQLYAFLPLKLGVYINGMVGKRNLKYIITVCFIWIVLGNIYVNPKLVIIDLIAPALFTLYYLFFIGEKRGERYWLFSYVLKFLGVLFLFSTYWLVPAFGGIKDNLHAAKKAYNLLGGRERVSTFKLNSATSLLEAARLWGCWAVYTSYKAEQYYYWTDLYRHTLRIIMGYLVFGIASWPCLKKQNKLFYFFYGLLIISIFGMSGAAPEGAVSLLGIVNLFFAKQIPMYVDIFSLPYFYWGLFAAMAFAVLFSHGAFSIYESYLSKKVNVNFFSIFIFLFIALYSWPMWTGNVFRPQTPIMRGSRYSVPQYYYDADDYFSEKRLLSRIYPLPYSSQGYMINKWDSGFIGFGIFHLLSDRMIYGMCDVSLLTNKAFNSIENSINIYPLLAFQGVRNILLQNDANWIYYKDHPWYWVAGPGFYRYIIQNLSGLTLTKTFGALQFYKLDDKYFTPIFYAPKIVRVYDAPTDILLSDESIAPDPNMALYFTSENNREGSETTVLNTVLENIPTTPVMEFKRISASKYRVRVHGAKDTFPLIFSTTFNRGWSIYRDRMRAAPQDSMRNLLPAYKILDGNADDQANYQELSDYISRGWVTSLGDGSIKRIKHRRWDHGVKVLRYIEKVKVDFISKNIKGTIQNENLPKGAFYETWWRTPINHGGNHLMVNGYSNSWIIDPQSVCAKDSSCVRNPDGTYDFGLVVEYRPQRIFYLGLFISILSAICGSVFLLYGLPGFPYRLRRNFSPEMC